jgi:ribosome modulation factor
MRRVDLCESLRTRCYNEELPGRPVPRCPLRNHSVQQTWLKGLYLGEGKE